MPSELLMKRIDELEFFMRQHYRTFVRKKGITSDRNASDYISILEKARIIVQYRHDPFTQDKELRQHIKERLMEFYQIER